MEIINCLSLEEFNDHIEKYLRSWVDSNSKATARSEMSRGDSHIVSVVDIHNSAVVYRYTFIYHEFVKKMTVKIEIANFE